HEQRTDHRRGRLVRRGERDRAGPRNHRGNQMSSENNAPPTITPRLTVPRPDTDASSRTGAPAPARHGEADGSSSNGTSGGSSNGASKASSNGAAASAVPPPPPPPPATTRDVPAPAVDDDGMERASG